METLYAILPLAGRFILVSGLLMALYWILWRKGATYRAKRTYLLAVPFMAMVIALLQVEVYKPSPVVVTIEKKAEVLPTVITEEAPLAASAEGVETTIATPMMTTTEATETIAETSRFSTLNIAALAYTIIFIALSIPFIAGFVQLMMLRKKANEQEDKENNIRILMGEAIKAPFSFYRSIFLPSNLTDNQRRMILAHEKAHIKHRHYMDAWVSAFVTRLFWWNPFLWWAQNELRNVHEFEADSVVLGTGEDLFTYQSILIEEVMHGDIVIANGFNHSFIRRRFIEMVESTNRHMSKWRKIGTGVWMLLIVALFCCSVGKAETIYKTVIVNEPQNLVAEVVTETAKEESPILIDTLTLSKDKPFLVFQDSVAISLADDDFMLFDDTVVIDINDSPLTVEANNLEQAELLKGLLNTLSSLQEITPAQYEELQKESTEPIQDLEEINQMIRFIKEDTNNRFSESLNRLLAELVRSQNSSLLSSGLINLLDKQNITFNISDLPQTSELHRQMVQQLMLDWLLHAELSEETYTQSKALSENPESLPSLEEINQNLRENRLKRISVLLEQIKEMDESLGKQIEELIAKYGMSPKEEEIIEIPITFKDGKVIIYKKEGNSFSYHERDSFQQTVQQNLRQAKEDEFVIEGFVDENITDSCYNIYLADEHFLIQDEPVATVPVVNKRFTYVLKLDKMTAGRLRCIFPGGKLCDSTISLYFVPGETVKLNVHNGYYNIRKSEEYDNKVTRAMKLAREESNWKMFIKGNAWETVEHKKNNYNLLIKEVYFNDEETVLRIANKEYGESLIISKDAYLTDDDGNQYRLLRAVKGNIGSNNEPHIRIFGGYFAFEPMPKDTKRLTFHDQGIEIKNIRKAK